MKIRLSRTRVLSVLMTGVALTSLVMVGSQSARAVNVDICPPPSSVWQGSPVTFNIEVTIDENELLPIEDIFVTVTGGPSAVPPYHPPFPSGVPYSYGYRLGQGYGYSPVVRYGNVLGYGYIPWNGDYGYVYNWHPNGWGYGMWFSPQYGFSWGYEPANEYYASFWTSYGYDRAQGYGLSAWGWESLEDFGYGYAPRMGYGYGYGQYGYHGGTRTHTISIPVTLDTASLSPGTYTLQAFVKTGTTSWTFESPEYDFTVHPAPRRRAGVARGAAADTTPPEIFACMARNITKTSADICWKTDEPSDSRVEIQASPSELSPLDETMVTEHEVHLTGLTPVTNYHFKAMSKDKAGNLGVSDEHTFTTLGIPAAFTTSGLSISPSEVDIGERVTISAKVANTGDIEGAYEVVLKINGVIKATKAVTIDAGASETVTFTTPGDAAGTYNVSVDGLSGTFAVKELVPPPVAPPAAPPAVPPVVPPVPPAPEPINWPLIGGIIGAVIVAGLLASYFLWWRRRAA